MGTQRRELASLLEEYRAMRRRVAGIAEDVAAMTATARSTDGCVTATVGPRGELRELQIDPVLARRIDVRTLASRVVEAAGLAEAQARSELGATVAAMMPAHLRHLVSADGVLDVRGLLPDDLTAMVPDHSGGRP